MRSPLVCLPLLAASLTSCMSSFSAPQRTRAFEPLASENEAMQQDPREAALLRLELENRLLRQDLAALQERFASLWNATGHDPISFGPWIPRIDALILQVDLDDTVTLDAGSNNLVQIDQVFHVHRGATYVGQLRVQRVERDRCHARITKALIPMALGDQATTRL